MNQSQRQTLERVAYQMVRAGRIDDARAVLRGLTRVAPESSYAWRGLALIARDEGDDVIALEFARAAHGANPDAPSLLLLAELLIAAGETGEARALLGKIESFGESTAQQRAIVLRKQWFGA